MGLTSSDGLSSIALKAEAWWPRQKTLDMGEIRIKPGYETCELSALAKCAMGDATLKGMVRYWSSGLLADSQTYLMWMKSLVVLRWPRRMYWHYQAGFSECSRREDHDDLWRSWQQGSASKGRRRRGCNEHAFDSEIMMRLGRVEQW